MGLTRPACAVKLFSKKASRMESGLKRTQRNHTPTFKSAVVEQVEKRKPTCKRT